MKKSGVVLLALFAMASVMPDAHAIKVTRKSSIDALGGAVAVSPVTISDVAKTIALDLDVLLGHTTALIGFEVEGEGEAITDFYTVTLTSKNLVTPFNTGLGWAMNGYDVRIIGPTSAPFVSLSTPTTSVDGKFAVVNPNTISGGGRRFGGMLGGGGEIYNGASAITSFRVAISPAGTSDKQDFHLQFTANPEPATLLLGTLAMIPAGLVIRRRRKAAAEVVA